MNYLVANEDFFPERPGGAGRVAWTLAKLMRNRGHRVAFVGGTSDPANVGTVEHEGITVARYLYPRLRAWDPRRLAAHIDVARTATAALGRRWDVVHSHTLAPGLGAFAASRGARRIATVHSPAVLEQRITWRGGGASGALKLLLGEPILKRAERKLYDDADSMVALSDFTVRETRAIHGSPVADRMSVIPWWSERDSAREVDPDDARHQLGWNVGDVALFTLRRLVPRMGVDVLVRAASRLPRALRWAVHVGGDGPEREKLENLARSLGCSDRVRFLGRMTDAQVDLAYTACDAFILPTRALECFGIIALDALARGRPVVGARVGAIPEMLEPILPEWLFSPGDPEALARLLRRLIEGDLRAPPAGRLMAFAADRYGRGWVSERWARWIEDGAARGQDGEACGY